jgi:hypothetical protein
MVVQKRAGLPAAIDTVSGGVPGRFAGFFDCCLYSVWRLARGDSGFSAARFDAVRALDGESRLTGVRGSYSRAKWNYSKITINNSMLRGKFDHGCVLFVQHPLEKGRSQRVGSGSFVACAEVLGNCDDATEGGIPRSSR